MIGVQLCQPRSSRIIPCDHYLWTLVRCGSMKSAGTPGQASGSYSRYLMPRSATRASQALVIKTTCQQNESGSDTQETLLILLMHPAEKGKYCIPYAVKKSVSRTPCGQKMGQHTFTLAPVECYESCLNGSARLHHGLKKPSR